MAEENKGGEVMRHVVQFGFLVLGVSALLLTSGCEGGGGSSGSLGAVGSLASGVGGVGGVGGSDAAATVTQPEPASVALFGGGLAGLALWRRRKGKARKRS